MLTPIFLTTKEAAQRLQMSVRSVQDLCAAKAFGFPAVRCGKKYLINAELLEDWARKVATERDDIFFSR